MDKEKEIEPTPSFQYTKPMEVYSTRCTKCGFILKSGVGFGYVCGHIDCPIFPNVTCGSSL